MDQPVTVIQKEKSSQKNDNFMAGLFACIKCPFIERLKIVVPAVSVPASAPGEKAAALSVFPRIKICVKKPCAEIRSIWLLVRGLWSCQRWWSGGLGLRGDQKIPGKRLQASRGGGWAGRKSGAFSDGAAHLLGSISRCQFYTEPLYCKRTKKRRNTEEKHLESEH